MTQPKKPPDEYISKVTKLYSVWARENQEINSLVFKDLDIIFNKWKAKAYNDGYYEAFAHLEKLHEYLRTGLAETLAKELDYIKKLPE